MKLEQFSIEQVRNEYVNAVAQALKGKVTQVDFNKILTAVDDFCTALSSNNIMLIKVIDDTPYGNLPEEELNVQEETVSETPEDLVQEEDEFAEESLDSEETALAEAYKQKMKELEERERQIKELENAKPIKFTDKVRQFETDNVKKKLDDEDEE